MVARAAEAGGLKAVNNLSIPLEWREEVDVAETWHWRAVEAGDTGGAKGNLGVLLKQRGEVAEAELWCRRAPRAWGSLKRQLTGQLRSRSIPTCVGLTGRPSPAVRMRAVHSHVRGAHTS